MKWPKLREKLSGALKFFRWRPFGRLVGAAANPRETPRSNPAGTPPRKLEHALEIAREAGVEIDNEDFSFSISPVRLDRDVGATYFDLDKPSPASLVEWKNIVNRHGKVHVIVCPSILESDEEIVHTSAHEIYEATRLREHFQGNGGRMPASVVRSLVHRDFGKLHCEAWEYADELLRARRRRHGSTDR